MTTWKSKKVSNLSKDFSRVNLDVGVSYSSNLEHVISVINTIEQSYRSTMAKFDHSSSTILRVNEFAKSAIMLKNFKRNLLLNNGILVS
jgi:small conductance mechanosensitive channel